MKNSKFGLNFVYRSLFFFVGILIATLGIAVMYEAETLGVGAYDALNKGLSNSFGHSVGFWVNVNGMILIAIEAVIRRGVPRFLAIIPLLLVGICVDFWIVVLESVQPSPGIGELIAWLLGMLLMGLGVAIYLQPKFVPPPPELILMSVSGNFNLSIRMTKTIIEVIMLSLALLVDGPIGIGTIIITLSIGPTIQFFFSKANRLYSRVAK